MLEELKFVLDAALFTAPGGRVITLGQITAVLLLLVFGYLGSRLVGYLLGRRLATTKLRPGVVYVLKRNTFRFRITELFDQNGIVIAFPQRDVHLDSSSPLEIRMINKETNRDSDNEPIDGANS